MPRSPFLGGLGLLLFLLFFFVAFAVAAVIAAIALLITMFIIFIIRRRRRAASLQAAEPLTTPYPAPVRARDPTASASATVRGSGDARLNRLVLSLLEKERTPYRRARNQDYEDL